MRDKLIVAGTGVYRKCCDCEKLVKINKLFFGDLHFCLTDEEIAEKRRRANGRYK